AVSLPLESRRASADSELSARTCARVRAGQELDFFISDAQGATLSGTSPNSTFLSVGERVHLGVAAERCFLFSGGKRFYL
ncbi:TOBE domain-containing protein, partial [Rothia mucilaginosa]|uniref:TOBE domain-containing protein n=1 Tax=Rothia mucilaginosa TaxID=43675 RepID=UPI003B5A2FF4